MKHLFLGFMLTITVLGTALFVAPAPTASACQDSYFAVPAWYRGLQDGNCGVVIPKTPGGDTDVSKFILTIAMNLIQAGLTAAAYVATFFIIKGGFAYITSAGSSDGMASAKKTITNAVIGLVIAILSASIVNAIAGII